MIKNWLLKNPALTAFLFFLLIVILWFSADALLKIQNYHALQEKVEAKNLNWFVEEISSDDFRLGANYTFTPKNDTAKRQVQGETIFSSPKFRNPSSADDELKLIESKKFTVFYDPENSDHSSLQKKFPTKECVYLGFLILLFLYFIFLGIYAARTITKS